MGPSIQLVIDAGDPRRLAEFWAQALDYVIQPPPEGFDSWEDFARKHGVPEERWNDQSAIVDPDGGRPRIFLQRVPESKQGKNRLHIDISASGGLEVPPDERRDRVAAKVKRLVEAGATRLDEHSGAFGEYWIVMQDPEGNEFCVQ